MNFPDEYIKRGDFKLHSGQKTDRFYDINSLITDENYLEQIIRSLPVSNHYIGIATGGALIALAASRRTGAKFSMIKDGELKGNPPIDEWILVDDVTTTENSLRDALKIVPTKPKEIYVVVDRRAKKNLKINSIYEVKE